MESAFLKRRVMESFSHAWSAHPLYHLMEILGGVRQTGLAWKTISFAPTFLGDHADATIPTPPGKIRTAWTRSGHCIRVSLKQPKGITATVRLPGERQCRVQGAKTWNLEVG
jgi:hypothetical protein